MGLTPLACKIRFILTDKISIIVSPKEIQDVLSIQVKICILISMISSNLKIVAQIRILGDQLKANFH
jgi:hypothetical protein